MMRMIGSVYLALIVATCCLVDVSQALTKPSDSLETAGLQGKYQVFADFCISTRDDVMGEFEASGSGLGGDLIRTFFNGNGNSGFDSINRVPDMMVEKLKEAMATNGANAALNELKEVCDRIAHYNEELNERFQATKDQLVAKDSKLSGIAISDVNCFTSRRIINLSGYCKTTLATQKSMMRFFALNPAPESQ